jgi:ABC-type uncharacterized transport system permease subunit
MLAIGPTIGAGIFVLFGRAWIGFALGLMAHAVRQVAFIYLLHDHRRDVWTVAVLLWLTSIAALVFAVRHYAAKKKFQLHANEIPQAANSVVGGMRDYLPAAGRVVGAELRFPMVLGRRHWTDSLVSC